LTNGRENGEIPLGIDTMATSRFFATTLKGLSVAVRSKTDSSVFDDTINIAMLVIDELGNNLQIFRSLYHLLNNG